METTQNQNPSSPILQISPPWLSSILHHDHDHAEKEPMFQKPLTPSDVGKLNRLVIPKQYAEKYFPLGGAADSSAGLLLSFEDESGKCWTFRYSYWNSSQSYVLTKGWSRYVKENKLAAGDVVLFERHRFEEERLFIGWKKRGDGHGSNSGWSGSRGLSLGHHVLHSAVQLPHCLHHASAGVMTENQIEAEVNTKKHVRLFGVNLECELEELSDVGTSLSNQEVDDHGNWGSPSTHNYMDINFSRDINETRNYQG